MHEGFRLPRPISLARRRSPGLRRGPGCRRRGRARHGRACGGCAADVRLRRQGAPPPVDAGWSGRLAGVAWRLPRACALASPPVAQISGGSAAPCGDPHPPGGGRLRAAGPAPALGLALDFRTRPGVDHGIIAPAGSPVDLCARHGRFPAVEAALKRFAALRARTVRGGDRIGRGPRRGSTGVEGAPAPPGLGRQRTVPGPRWTSGLVGSPARCAGCRVAGSAHPYRSTRAAIGLH